MSDNQTTDGNAPNKMSRAALLKAVLVTTFIAAFPIWQSYAGTPAANTADQEQVTSGGIEFSSVTFDDSIIARALTIGNGASPTLPQIPQKAYSGFVPVSKNIVAAIQKAIKAYPAGVYKTKSLVLENIRHPDVMRIGMSLDVRGIQAVSPTLQLPDVHTITLAAAVSKAALGQALLIAVDTTKVLTPGEEQISGMHGHRVWLLAIPSGSTPHAATENG